MKYKLYLHSNKSSQYEDGEELGLKEEALTEFCYAGYEVEIKCNVDIHTGIAYATHLNNIPLEKKVRV
jgi:hypothetical protein